MSNYLLKKVIEVELFGGTPDGQVLPLSGLLKERFRFVSQEPDQRNFEYITKPTTDYNVLIKEIIKPRIKIRKFLSKSGMTLIPGSTIPLSYSKNFYPSDPRNSYHNFIQRKYKTKIITTSLHMNFGIEDNEKLFKLIAALRLDLPIILALSASSCFHDGKLTNYDSFRWHMFPRNPSHTPIFTSHKEHINWINKNLKNKRLQNVRHLWTSIRPNGPNRPYDLNRIEIRISDFVSDTKKIIAIVALIEALILNYILHDKWPTVLNTNQKELNKIAMIMEKQEDLVAKEGLNATIWDWRSDTKNKTFKVIENIIKELQETLRLTGLLKYQKEILDILENGNESTQFISIYNKKRSISPTLKYGIEQFNYLDLKYSNDYK